MTSAASCRSTISTPWRHESPSSIATTASSSPVPTCPSQELKDGNLEILVLEGHIGKVDVKYNTAGPKIAQPVLKSFVEDAAPPSKPVTVSSLERGMLLENDLPNMAARATLIPGASSVHPTSSWRRTRRLVQ